MEAETNNDDSNKTTPQADAAKSTRVRPYDAAARREYNVKLYARSVTLPFRSADELDKFRLMAQQSGYAAFTPWVLQMIYNATSGSLYPPEYVEGLKQEGERLRRWHEASKEEADDYKRQVRRLQEQRDSLLVLLHSLPTGGEVAARFLQQSTREARA